MFAVFRGGGEVAVDRAELLGSGEGSQAAGHLLPEFDHADVAFGADLGGRSVERDLLAERVGVEVRVLGGEGFGDQLLHGHKRIGGLAGPAPVGIRGRGVRDPGQLAQRVGTTELVVDIDIGVIGRLRVVHREAGEPAQDAGVVDALATALGVAGDQGVLVRAGAVDPVQAARHPQPGLVEPGHLGLGQAVGELVEEAVEALGLRLSP